MSQVTLEIGGRSYSLSCAQGQEAHIMQLGRRIDEKVAAVTGGKRVGDSQALLFAALTLADELHEAQQKPEGDTDALVSRLDELANGLEKCAAALETAAAGT